ncbi:hypothetical protein CL632_01855 [bacterium]|jgi:hypothetical protein|nr:hypothetical protein [bacterium]MDP6571575.1 hypothetical protein [Patescibacteria group bacterium]MDP6756093.1 hypothetical protein [Patescibacteria group bacterium]|tara:strand:+ start:552 stop:773 length:222 start_codon:yes stop_codon:yes gene_type:complete
MSIAFLGFTLTFLGKLLIAFTAIMVHHRVVHEHRIDKAVFKSMKREQKFGILGVIFLVTGYLLEFPNMWDAGA